MSQAQDDLVAAASNPNTDLTKLHELANNYPGLRPYIATNPRTYPALLEWLGTLGDPAVDAALARRYGPAQPLTTAPADGATQILAPGQIGVQSPQSPPQQQSLTETQRQQPFQPEYAQQTQTFQQPQYQPVQPEYAQQTQAFQQPQYQPVQPGYAQQTQTFQQPQYQPVQPEYARSAQSAQQAPEGVFGVGEAAEEETGPRPTLWLWILGAVAVVAVVAVVVWFILSNHGGGDSADDNSADSPVATTQSEPSKAAPSKKASPSAAPTPSATPTPKITAPAPANAIELSAFTAPSGNITCTLTEDSVTCTINEHNFTPTDASCRNSASSPVTWTVKKDGSATSSCGGSFSSAGAQLQYGSAAKNDSFACTSSENGVECWSQITGQGFKVSRDDSRGTSKSAQH
ncbi:variant leucine-rich repeat-containing protein [Actinomyces israelii]